MAGNSFGQLFKVSTFGESHGAGIGVFIDGFPPNLLIDTEAIRYELSRRKPGQSELSTQRKETEEFEFLSGVYEGRSTGAPIVIFVRNKDQRSTDYTHLENIYRPGHADYTYDLKYGIRDHRGSGRASARETLARVIAGCLARQILGNAQLTAYVSEIGGIGMSEPLKIWTKDEIEASPLRCPEIKTSQRMEELVRQTMESGDSLGGIIHCRIKGLTPGLGEPVFDKLQADLAKAMLSINAAKGFDYGSGFPESHRKGSELNDSMDQGKIFVSNHSGGIQGGISNGEDIYFRVVFKPVSSIRIEQQTSDTAGNRTQVSVRGRHDPLVLPRAVPIVEAMAAIVLADHVLRLRAMRG